MTGFSLFAQKAKSFLNIAEHIPYLKEPNLMFFMKTKHMNQSLNKLNFIARAIDHKLSVESLGSLPKYSIIMYYIEDITWALMFYLVY